jgi:hypothetical protein
MWKLRCIAVSGLLLAGCVTEPLGPTITGTWGGTGLLINATNSGATLYYYCSHGQAGPLRIDVTGRAAAEGRYFPWQQPSDSPVSQPLWVEARAAGDSLVVVSYIGARDSTHAATFLVRRDAESDVSSMACLQ